MSVCYRLVPKLYGGRNAASALDEITATFTGEYGELRTAASLIALPVQSTFPLKMRPTSDLLLENPGNASKK